MYEIRKAKLFSEEKKRYKMCAPVCTLSNRATAWKIHIKAREQQTSILNGLQDNPAIYECTQLWMDLWASRK